jgi:hypothetical protein
LTSKDTTDTKKANAYEKKAAHERVDYELNDKNQDDS